MQTVNCFQGANEYDAAGCARLEESFLLVYFNSSSFVVFSLCCLRLVLLMQIYFCLASETHRHLNLDENDHLMASQSVPLALVGCVCGCVTRLSCCSCCCDSSCDIKCDRCKSFSPQHSNGNKPEANVSVNTNANASVDVSVSRSLLILFYFYNAFVVLCNTTINKSIILVGERGAAVNVGCIGRQTEASSSSSHSKLICCNNC